MAMKLVNGEIAHVQKKLYAIIVGIKIPLTERQFSVARKLV